MARAYKSIAIITILVSSTAVMSPDDPSPAGQIAGMGWLAGDWEGPMWGGVFHAYYCTPEGGTTSDGNPNGSIRNIAGIFNETKTVLGLMPHPENAVEPELGPADGAALFSGLTAALH